MDMNQNALNQMKNVEILIVLYFIAMN